MLVCVALLCVYLFAAAVPKVAISNRIANTCGDGNQTNAQLPVPCGANTVDYPNENEHVAANRVTSAGFLLLSDHS